MGLNLKTLETDETRGMTITELDNVNFLLTRETQYQSYYIYAYRDRRNGENNFVGNAGSCLNSEFDDALTEDFPEDVDIYICPNGTVTPYKRTKESIVNIQNLIIDIDAHNCDLSIEELNVHIDIFSEQLLDKLEIKPNFIHHTGRGIHLWYCIEPLHSSLDYAALSVIDMLCKDISKHMDEFNETILTLDKNASMKLSGLYRLPYTYNTSAKMWSHGELIHEEIPHVNQLKDKLFEMGYTSDHWRSNKQLEKNRSRTITKYAYKQSRLDRYKEKRIEDKNKDYTNCINHRIKFLDKLITDGKINDGRRHCVFLALCATLIRKYDNNETWNLINEYNYLIEPPLTQNELSDIYQQVIKKTHKFKNLTFLEFIMATDEEVSEFYKRTQTIKQKAKEPKKKRTNKRQLARDAKKDKYNQVIELYNQGMKKIDISKELHISRPTIDKIIRESL